MPVILINDDSCTYVDHWFHRFPIEAELAFGSTRGCFERPSEDTHPTSGLSCPDILPTEIQTTPVNRDSMKNPSILDHPDVRTQQRYVFGTRLDNRILSLNF